MSVPDWLPEPPRHWTISPLGFRYEVQLGKMLNPDAAGGDHLAPYLRNTDVQWGRINVEDLPLMSFDARERAKFALRPGDLLVCEGGDVGRAAIWNGELTECFYQKALHRVRPWRSTDVSRFLYYVLAAASWRGAFLAEGNRSTIVHLTAEKLRAMRFSFPPVAEQVAITDFLDRKTAAIDELIEKKERLIRLLSERAASDLSTVMTRGLDAGVPMRSTGRGFLPEVPAHWRIVPLKRATLDGDGLKLGPFGTALQEAVRYEPDQYRVYGQENTISGDFSVVRRWISAAHFAAMRVYELRPGDIVLTRKGSLGNCRLVPHEIEPGIIDSDTVRVRVNQRNVVPLFLVRLLHEAAYVASQIEATKRGAILSGMNTETVGNLLLGLPPIEEQARIIEHVDDRSRHREALIAPVRLQLDHLREYRQALITAAVTGQLDIAAQEAA